MLRKLPLQVVDRAIQLGGRQRHKALVVRPQHDHVQIVIPRDESAMPHGTQRRTGKQCICNMVFFAHAVDLVQHLQQGQLVCAQCARLRFGHHRYFFNPLNV